MRKARLITIGTEITSGEVVNSNAAWVSLRLEELGVRVFSHLSVRDQREEIARALRSCDPDDLVIVTGGLGPTSDDITRECVALHCGRRLEFDDQVWRALEALYQQRGLPLREAHRQQCFFPEDSVRLSNPIGTALGFALDQDAGKFFVLPGPPGELEAMWLKEVEPRLKQLLPPRPERWVRWTCLGAPESEIAELVEQVIAGEGIEVGYRAQIPYVKIKVFLDPVARAAVVQALDQALAPFVVGRGDQDLAQELLERWPATELHVCDEVTGGLLFMRLLKAREPAGPQLALHIAPPATGFGLCVSSAGGNLLCELRLPSGAVNEERELPYRVKLDSERGRRSAAEWAIWSSVKALRAQPSTSS